MLKSLSSIQTNFDWQRLNQLADEDPDFAVELLSMFLKDTESSLLLLERAISAQSFQSIEDVSHAIRGASANVGAIAISEVAVQLEEAACCKDIRAVNRLLQLLYEQCTQLRAELSTKQMA